MATQKESEIFLKKASDCKPEELKDLLKQIENSIKTSNEKDKNLLMAKTIITARLTSERDKS